MAELGTQNDSWERGQALSGVLNVNKPLGLTSHDVVARLRRLTGHRRVGHAGTLDPLATGVLVVCLGSATRLMEYLADLPKEYRATVRLGVTTDTWDAEGDVVHEADAAGITREAVEAALSGFVGRILQVPPMYSAVKRRGKPLYRLARKGITVEREPREIEIHSLDLEIWQPPEAVLRVHCSKGTYVRALAHDLGERLGVGGYLSALERTAVGHLRVEDALGLEALDRAGAEWYRYLVPSRDALRHLPSAVLGREALDRLRHGLTVSIEGVAATRGPLCALDDAGTLVAILRSIEAEGVWQPEKVLDGAAA